MLGDEDTVSSALILGIQVSVDAHRKKLLE